MDNYIQVPEIVLKGIVHDLNNALCITGEMLSLLRNATNSGDMKTASAILDEMELATAHCTGITRQLGCFAGNGDSAFKKADLEKILRAVSGLALRGSFIECKIFVSGGNLHVDCNGTEIARALFNIILNSRQAINGNGGSVRIVLEGVDIVSCNHMTMKSGSYAKISVSDTGSGISPENMKHIFSAGFTTKGDGHGVGLASSLHTVRKYGGDIEVKSEVGVGTTFEIYLPVEV